MHTHLKRNTIYSSGSQIGTGKESDIHAVASPSGVQYALKIHRLGRISFRSVKKNRDYLRHRSAASWLYMSRLAALKEYAFLTALRAHGFPVPEPVAQNRHTLVMELIQALPLRQINEVLDPAGLYAELLELILRLADHGLIHGDFNEFNILLREDETSPSLSSEPSDSSTLPTSRISQTPILIDFPQMISIDHMNAEMYFARDVDCIKRFFERRFHFTSDEPGPFFADACARARRRKCPRLDVEVEASGFSRKMARELDQYMDDVGKNEIEDDEGAADGEDAEDDGKAKDDNEEAEDDGEAEDYEVKDDRQGGDNREAENDEIMVESVNGHDRSETDRPGGARSVEWSGPRVESLAKDGLIAQVASSRSSEMGRDRCGHGDAASSAYAA